MVGRGGVTTAAVPIWRSTWPRRVRTPWRRCGPRRACGLDGRTRWLALQYTLDIGALVDAKGHTPFDAIGLHTAHWRARRRLATYPGL